MCGRFVLFQPESFLDAVGQWPGVSEVHAPQGLPPARYNIAPTQTIPIIRVKETFAAIEPARWGLLPHWKKDEQGPPLFNARAETVASKPSFRDAYKKNRCVIPLDGYYEWHTGEDGKKQPYYVTAPEGQLWAAGLWGTGLDKLSATMVTTAATDEMEWLHGRLPKFLLSEEIRPWLEGDMSGDLLQPSGLRGFHTRPADPAVGNVRNDYAELIEGPAEKTLF
ncbi:SOS response-associated peptidase [Corynebacterium sp. SA-MJD20WY100]|uniref:SOS response-associated peptidase n=1 Tax=Corynebacterium sp. SA-MJD20WY100 TaxID=3142969 RepID=UPI0032215022